jgi:hypothetical protein
MKFLKGPSMLSTLQSLVGSNGEIAYLAVAFWGKGAIEQLNLEPKPGRRLRVICNLSMGGTNADEITDLMKLPRVEVKHSPWLHAKVYWTEQRCIVGSANASSNGLGWEGSEARSFLEAGLLVTEPALNKQIGEWVKELWTGSKTIGPKDIAKASRDSAFIRNNRTSSPDESSGKVKFLRDALRSDAQNLADRRLYLRWQFVTEESKTASKVAKKKRRDYKPFQRSHAYLETTAPIRERDFPKDSQLIYALDWNPRNGKTSPKDWDVDQNFQYVGDWNDNRELITPVNKGWRLVWFRERSAIRFGAGSGGVIRLSLKDRRFIQEIVALRENLKLDRNRDTECIEFGELLRWCEANRQAREIYQNYVG